MSYAAEVIADSTGEWCGNGLRFATADEARTYADDLMFRWTAVCDTRVVESNDAPNVRLSPDLKVVAIHTEQGEF